MKGTVNENVKTLGNIASVSVAVSLDDDIPKKHHAKYQSLPKSRKKMLTFSERLQDLKPDLKDWYDSLLAEMLSYKRVKNRVSERYNTIRLANTPLMRISLRKNIIRLYFNLEPSIYPKDFKLKDKRDKVAFANFPSLLTVISERSYQNALALIEELAGKFGLVQNDNFNE